MAQEPNPQELLDSDEVAEILGVSAKTVRHYRWAGTLPADDRKGRTPLWYRSTIEQFNQTRRGPGRPSAASKLA